MMYNCFTLFVCCLLRACSLAIFVGTNSEFVSTKIAYLYCGRSLCQDPPKIRYLSVIFVSKYSNNVLVVKTTNTLLCDLVTTLQPLARSVDSRDIHHHSLRRKSTKWIKGAVKKPWDSALRWAFPWIVYTKSNAVLRSASQVLWKWSFWWGRVLVLRKGCP